MLCARCKRQNREGRRFCAQCGAELVLSCAACGFENQAEEAYCGGCGMELGATASGAAVKPPAALPDDAGSKQAERRQLTVMFSDLADSTALSTRLDPEEMSGVLRSYQRCCAGIVRRFGGRVAKYMGDGVLVYFGYPLAHENDTERAVLAGLAIANEVRQLRPSPGLILHARVGIATGLVVVGELIGEGESQEQAVVGQTPNLAARLQSVAALDAIVISANTRRLIGGLFECRDLGMLSLKGFGEPVRAWCVQGESRATSRFEALRAETMSPVIGRDPELGMLLDRWERVQDGEGQVVLVSGEAGVGKSRLTRALIERLSDGHYTRLSYSCSPHHQTSALYPVIAELQRAAGITHDDTSVDKLDKLEAWLGTADALSCEMITLMAALLSIPTGERYPALALSPAQAKENTSQAMLLRLEALAVPRPMLCLVEDAHWIDPTSLELVTRLTQRLKALPILLVITFRPEFDASAFSSQGHVSQIRLSRLTRRQVAVMVEHCAGGKKIPVLVLEEIVAKADGVPLYIEELTKTVLESGLLREELDCFILDGPLTPLAVPATLHDSLMARLDKMSTVKQVAQLAATIGRSFTREQLAAVSPLVSVPLDDALARLVEAEMIHREDRPPQVLFQFKHALLRDVAYQSLLKPTRQQYHGHIARALEEKFPATAEMQPELLAYHFAEAGQVNQAIDYWLRAGQRAAQRSSNLEAIAQLSAALSLIPGITDGAERSRMEYRLRLAVIPPLMATSGYASSEMDETIARALQLSEEIGDPAEIFPVLYNRYSFEMASGQICKGFERAEEAQRFAERNPRYNLGAVAGVFLGMVMLVSGDPKSALPLFEYAMVKYDVERDRSSAFVYGQDHFVLYGSYLCLTLLHLGKIEQARDVQRQVLAHARSLSHLNTLCYALAFVGCTFEGFLRDGRAMEDYATEISTLCAEHTLVVWTAGAKVYMGHALAEQGRPADATDMMAEGLAELDAIQVKVLRPRLLIWYAEALGKVARPAAGLQVLADARVVTEGGEHWMDAEIHRLEGELLSKTPGAADDKIEESFLAAVTVARDQNMLLLELRAATSLCRFWGRRAKAVEARSLLDDVLSRFGSTATTVDLEEARALRKSLD
jgi:class 3 adenylate cyclase/predicted ATPase